MRNGYDHLSDHVEHSLQVLESGAARWIPQIRHAVRPVEPRPFDWGQDSPEFA